MSEKLELSYVTILSFRFSELEIKQTRSGVFTTPNRIPRDCVSLTGDPTLTPLPTKMEVSLPVLYFSYDPISCIYTVSILSACMIPGTWTVGSFYRLCDSLPSNTSYITIRDIGQDISHPGVTPVFTITVTITVFG